MGQTYVKNILKKTLYKNYLKQKGAFNYFGEKVFFPKNSTTFIVVNNNGIYEHEILKFLLNNIKDNSTYLDIGANIGLMSIPVLKQNKTIKVISVEASPNTFSFLKKTHAASSFKNQWVIYNNAVSDNNGELDFFISANADGSYESMKDTGRTTFSEVIKIAGKTINEIWKSAGTPLVSVIKSDIEGADLLALRGGEECIRQCRPMIVLEWNKVNIGAYNFQHQDLLDFCSKHNYYCYAIPAVIAVNKAIELELHSILTENFLLVPG